MNTIPVITVPMESLVEVIQLQLENGGRANLTVTGSSMMPLFYNRRDAVTLIPVKDRQKKGDIILYRRENGMYVLHRIVRVEQDRYICSGDNQFEEEIVTHGQLIGVVGGFQRKGKTYELSHFGYRVYKTLWVELFPMRRGYIWLRRRMARVYRKLTAGLNRRKK